MVQVAVRRRGKLQRAEADIVERFVIDAKGLVGVLDELMHRESGIVGLDDRVRDLERQLKLAQKERLFNKRYIFN